jgi:hypothetical protein
MFGVLSRKLSRCVAQKLVVLISYFDSGSFTHVISIIVALTTSVFQSNDNYNCVDINGCFVGFCNVTKGLYRE